MMGLATYTGGFAIGDLCGNRRIALSTISAFNDPFELHFQPGPELSADQVRKMIANVPDGGRAVEQGFMRNMGITLEDFLQDLALGKEYARSMSRDVSASNWRETLRYTLEQADEMFRVLCCVRVPARPSSDVSMWAYYGHRHTGLRIHFTPEFLARSGMEIRKIRYRAKVPVYGFDQLYDEAKSKRLIDDVFVTKSRGWRQEREERLYFKIDAVPGLIKAAQDLSPDRKMRSWIEVGWNDIERIDLGTHFPNAWEAIRSLSVAFPNSMICVAEKSDATYGFRYKIIADPQKKNLTDLELIG